jgi:hypothetical protein
LNVTRLPWISECIAQSLQRHDDSFLEVRMRPVKHDDGHNPAVPATNPPRNTNLKRRSFLLTLGVGGAGAAAIAARSLSGGSVTATAADSPADDGGYAATAHVQTYYKTTKV